MDRLTAKLPFMAAFLIALSAMPLDIYQVNRRGVGTAKVSPWQRCLTGIRASGLWAGICALFQSPRAWQCGCAVVALLLVATGHLHAQHGAMAIIPFVGLTEAEEIREKANKIGTDMSAIMAKARDEKRDLTADEETSFDRMDADREKLLATEKRMLRAAELDGTRGRQAEHQQPARTAENPRQQAARGDESFRSEQARAEALQAWMLGGTEHRSGTHEAAARKLGIGLDQKSLIIRMPEQAPQSLRGEHIEKWEKRYLGVDVVSPDNGGHYAVPDEMMRELEVARLAFGGMLTAASVIRTTTGGSMPWPTMNDTSNEGALIGEAIQETAEAEPVLNQVVFNAYTYSSKKIFMSVEWIQDNAIGAVGRVGQMLGERLARIQNRHATVGTGTAQPRGIVVASTSSGVTTAAPGSVSYDDLVDLEHSVDPAYRSAARFMFNDTTLKLLKKIKVPQFDGDLAGYPLWKPGMVTGDPDTINGYAYTINQHMASGASAKSILFGDLSKYKIREVRDVQLMRLDELYAEYRQVVFLAFMRFDGDLVDAGTHPVKYLTQHA